MLKKLLLTTSVAVLSTSGLMASDFMDEAPFDGQDQGYDFVAYKGPQIPVYAYEYDELRRERNRLTEESIALKKNAIIKANTLDAVIQLYERGIGSQDIFKATGVPVARNEDVFLGQIEDAFLDIETLETEEVDLGRRINTATEGIDQYVTATMESVRKHAPVGSRGKKNRIRDFLACKKKVPTPGSIT